ncbi:NAD(P)H-dependent oxidoreductase [Alkalicella caledoniensis]|uniref:NAD(P)H-dependent oxidoreductase n=1 Tax=Alkalicella caledoniensis TaxID=2731377 RepID=A0A7G9W681_ALKCA|nr:NAD(P)H-dependent oxidoreductase [Alkalicella caledoniensis]QNO14193.1 NAD(P)H-dependent oxidoreductase [Alkalicella caledoniensis]
MKVAIIYGNCRKGSTYNCVKIVKETLSKQGDFEFQEIWLQKDLPDHCLGCFNCILKGEEYCPHVEKVAPIVDTLVKVDGIILASPVYGLDVSGAMKTFIDHLCFMWMPHRPKEEMFSKIGLVISTAAGTGTKRANKSMNLALDYMGVKRTYSFGANVAASKWEDINHKKRVRMERDLASLGKKYHTSLVKRVNMKDRLFTKGVFIMMKKMIAGYEDGNVDKEYWKSKGWL